MCTSCLGYSEMRHVAVTGHPKAPHNTKQEPKVKNYKSFSVFISFINTAKSVGKMM